MRDWLSNEWRKRGFINFFMMVGWVVFDVTASYNSMKPAARTNKNMTHTALPRSEAFHLRPEEQARARNERQRSTIGLRVRQRSTSVSLLLAMRPRGQLLYNNTFTRFRQV
ncbi:hypothetical protein EVAR_94936_1 [Eumeta japonica]|uniref:Uncharacterized protein n=1 Tax=Eumeta variegata TaxID=151549 RepID=A0A4C1Z3A8_EUMVA|nr:hypothetical protein EVAR_94936_1 [Eumeta japonica]